MRSVIIRNVRCLLLALFVVGMAPDDARIAGADADSDTDTNADTDNRSTD